MKVKITVLKMLLLMLCLQYTFSVHAIDRLSIYTVNYPLQYFAQRITRDKADVVFPAPKDIDPAFWSPDAKTVSAYQKADLILLNGANYAKWINKVSLSRLRMVNTSSAFAKDYIYGQSGVTHSHGAGPDHLHAGIAFTTWLDMQQAIQQAEAIKHAVIKKHPQYKAEFIKNFDRLKKDLLSLDAELKDIVVKNQNQVMLVSHPVYQYLARRYAMKLHSVVWEPDEFPSESQWNELEKLARTTSAKWMIWEAQPLQSSIDRLQSMGIGSVVFDPCVDRPDKGDFLSVMQKNIKWLRQIHQGQ